MGNTVSFKKEFGLIMVGAIVFTASFLWKDLLKDVEEYFFPNDYNMLGRILYTIIISVVLIMLAIHIRGYLGLNGNNEDDKKKIRYAELPFDDEPEIE